MIHIDVYWFQLDFQTTQMVIKLLVNAVDSLLVLIKVQWMNGDSMCNRFRMVENVFLK